MSFFHWIANAAKTAGRGLHSATHAISKVTGAVTNAVSHVPIVGKGLHGLFDLTVSAPFRIGDEVLSGKNIGKVAFDNFKHTVADIHDVAPYAQAVLSEVPGLGTGISGVIGASFALADGVPITQALLAGVKESMPGGVIGQSLFSVSQAVMSGKGIDQVALSALPIPDEQKHALTDALEVTKKIANGENVTNIAKDEAGKALALATRGFPIDVQKALKVGAAIGHAQSLQETVSHQAPSVADKLAIQGTTLVNGDPVLLAASKIVPIGIRGFRIGAALMRTHASAYAIDAIRKTLRADDLKAFDIALSVHIGRVTNPPVSTHEATKAGYYATLGMRGASEAQKVGMLHAVMADPLAKVGVTHALVKVETAKKSFWARVKEFITGTPTIATRVKAV